MKNKKLIKKDDIKNLKVEPTKGAINIVIKNDFVRAPGTVGGAVPPPEKPKRRRKRTNKKSNLDLLKMSTKPSYIPTEADINKIKPIPFKRSALLTPSQQQLQAQILSLPPYTQLPAPPQQLQLPAPPQQLQLPAPPPPPTPTPTQQPITVNFSGFNPMMPMEYGRGVTPIIEEIIDDLPDDKQELIIRKRAERQILPQLEELGVNKDEADQITQNYVTSQITSYQAKGLGTKDAKALRDPSRGDVEYLENYLSRLKQIVEKGEIKIKKTTTRYTPEQRLRAETILGRYDPSWTPPMPYMPVFTPPPPPMPYMSAFAPQPLTTGAAASKPPPPPPSAGLNPPPAPPPPPAAAAAGSKPPPPATTGASAREEMALITAAILNEDNIKIMDSIVEELNKNGELVEKINAAQPKGRANIFYSYLDKLDLKSYKLPYYTNKDIRGKLYKKFKKLLNLD